MSESGPTDLRKHFDWKGLVLFAIAAISAVAAFGDRIFSIGKSSAPIEKIERIEALQNQQSVDIVRAKLQAEMANAAALRVETKVDSQSTKLDHMNEVLLQLNITSGRRR